MATLHCSECGELVSSRQKTCSSKCRSARSRRIRAAKAHGGPRPAPPELSDADTQALIREIAKEELEPYVADQISADTIAAIGKMFDLVPKMTETLTDMLEAEDEAVRLRAAQTIAKYTMQEKFVPQAPKPPANVNLNVNLPSEQAVDAEVQEVDPDALATGERACSRCKVTKPPAAYEGGAPLCRVCHAERNAAILESHGDLVTT